MKARRSIKNSLFAGFALGLFLCCVLTGTAAGNDGSFIEYDTDGETEVISLQYLVDEVAEQDSQPRLRVYGDGRVVVHYSPFMKKAGTYKLQLSKQEMADLFHTILQSKVLDFDTTWVKQKKAEIQEKRRMRAREKGEPVFVHEVADADITRITFRLKRYRPDGAKSGTRIDVEKKISYRALRNDARQYSEIQMLAWLAYIEARLNALTERDDLVKMDK